ncbi:MAG: glycerol-3-phosphate 1-O-acyltransferase PlsY [bacterium]
MKSLIFLLAYLIGAIPFGFITAKVFNVDIRQQGSGNIGATNVFRTLGPVPGVIVFALDLLKGTAAVYLAQQFFTDPWIIMLTGLAAIVGHMFPVFLKFKGGKGAATGLGVLLGIAPDIFLGAAIVSFLIIALTRYVSVGSMVTVPLVALALLLLDRPQPYVIVTGIVALLVIIRHTGNIKRLLKGTENRIGGPSTGSGYNKS